MENKYEKFGLPDDPASQPIQPSPVAAGVQRGWFFHNLWWMLPAAFLVVLLPCGCCGGILFWVIGSLKSSEPYQMALHCVQAAPPVIEQLGNPSKNRVGCRPATSRSTRIMAWHRAWRTSISACAAPRARPTFTRRPAAWTGSGVLVSLT